MMEMVLEQILKISIYGAMISCVILLIRKMFGKRLSSRLHCVFWMILVVRLLFPFEIAVPYSVFDLFYVMPNSTYNQITDLPGQEAFIPKEVDVVPLGIPEVQATAKEADISIFTVASILWFCTALFFLLHYGIAYILTCRRIDMKRRKPPDVLLDLFEQEKRKRRGSEKIGLIVSDDYDMPFAYGIFRPVVVIPSGYLQMNTNMLSSVFAHELTHIRRKDHVTNLILCFTKSIYWFHPLVWLSFSIYKRDMEIACDSEVMEGCSEQERKSYANALLQSISFSPKRPLEASFFSEKRFYQERIRSIMEIKKTKQYSRLGTGMAILLLVVVLLTACQPQVIEHSMGYDNLGEIAEYETEYIGDNSKVGNILNLLSENFQDYSLDHFELQTAEKPYGLEVYFHAGEDTGVIPNLPAETENSAFIIFSFIKNADFVTFYFSSDQESQIEDMDSYTYQRKDLEERFGDLNLLSENPREMQGVLLQNRIDRVVSQYLHYTRTIWGSDQEYVIYRNGDPTDSFSLDDGEKVLFYDNLGEAIYTPEGSEESIVIPGEKISFSLYSPKAVEDGINGLDGMMIMGDSGLLSEFGLDGQSTYQEIKSVLGNPYREMKLEDGNHRTYYIAKGLDLDQYIWFEFEDDSLISHGITVEPLE